MQNFHHELQMLGMDPYQVGEVIPIHPYSRQFLKDSRLFRCGGFGFGCFGFAGLGFGCFGCGGFGCGGCFGFGCFGFGLGFI
ncbi:heterocycloanthracin/sonorensin family bacteriocin [Bacillus sp. EB600]|uniref:heterocycloanthracin/sonorensin family bacteriocin n=1 Tax=Bacillus sp. EB600 TaxID=2806345 RepID=UPI00210CE813|nr:heterocycloanthracin/sonorensin family bacteriocin [Bacillus sp. EB600]MCQ6282033.1 heterocycloanthracin/sonorensin family bacteriocin [Bacillus sp. EB600]